MYVFYFILLNNSSVETSSIILNESGESRSLCLVASLWRNTSFSPFCTILAVDLIFITFIMVRYNLICWSCLLNYHGIWNFIEFFLFIENHNSHHSIAVMDYVYQLMHIEFSLWWVIFEVVLDSICRCFVENFCKSVHQGYWSLVWFYCCVPFLALDSA